MNNKGPALANVPAGDWYLRLKQNIEALNGRVAGNNASNGTGVNSLNGLQGSISITGSAIRAVTSGQNIALFLENKGTAGTYVMGAKLTPSGKNGTITIDEQGRVASITPAT